MLINKNSKNNPTKEISTVFVIGCPRSGKTILHTLLAQHQKFGWFSDYANSFPKYPMISALNQIYRLKLLYRLNCNFKIPMLPMPVEAWNIWKMYAPIFGYRMGSLTSKDVTYEIKHSIRNIVKKHLYFQNKTTFITNYGRPCRIDFINEIFPNSKFIHLIRDGRAVAYEILKKGWFDNMKGIKETLIDVPERYVDEWHGSNKDKRVAAAIRWKVAMDEIEKQKDLIHSDQFLQVSYENFVESKEKVIDEITQFLGICQDDSLERAVQNIQLRNMNYLFETRLSDDDKNIIYQSLKNKLMSYNYKEEDIGL